MALHLILSLALFFFADPLEKTRKSNSTEISEGLTAHLQLGRVDIFMLLIWRML